MYSEISILLEKLTRHPLYHLLGIADDKLIYNSTREGSTDLWMANLDGSGEKILARNVIDVSRPRHKDFRVYYLVDVTPGKELHKIYGVDLRSEAIYEAVEMEPIRVFGLAHHNSYISYSGASERENVLYLSKEGEKPEKIYSSDKWIFTVDMNNEYIVGAGTFAGDPRSLELFIYSIEENRLYVYTPKEGSFNEPSTIYQDKILFTSNFRGSKQLYLYDIRRGELSEASFEGDEYKEFKFNDYLRHGFTEDGKIWFIGLYDYRGYAFLDGYSVYHPEGTPENIEVYGNEIYMTFSNIKTPYSIYKTGFDRSEWTRVIGEDLDKDIINKFGEVRIVKYRSFDGLEIPTIIFESNIKKPGPTILYVHGGPWNHVGDYWRIFIAALTASGFHVVAPNFRGSTGYGEDFRRLDIGDPGGGDLQDIIYARKHAFESGLTDKIAIMGYSYGGFMTYLATVKEPDLWDAGVAGAGIVDWGMMYELADAAFKHFQEILFAGNRELWRDRSAINFVEKLKAPLCILHPQNDTRTPLKPVLKYMDKLLEHGKVFEAHIFPDMGHIITKVDDAMKLLYPAIIFLYKTLRS